MGPALAFCNDIDFASWATYREVHRVLLEEFGIESQDSFWLFAPSGSEMALFKSSVNEKGPRHDDLLEEINSGRLAILHSAGNFSKQCTDLRPTRDLIAEGLMYLKEHAKVPIVWTNHGDHGDIQNIGGAQPTYQEGDDPASDAYILDILLQNGFRFFWTDNHCRNDFVFSGTGQKASSPLLVNEVTRSGHTITCFLRYRGGLPKAPDAQTLCYQITQENLDLLVKLGGVSVIYQHWSVHRDRNGDPHTASQPVFPQESLAALKLLIEYRERYGLRIIPLTKLLEETFVEQFGRGK